MAINTRKSIAQILREADETETEAGKVAILKHNESDVLKTLLRLAHDHNVKWLLPEGRPPFKPTDAANDVHARLYTEIKKFYLFVEGGNPPPPKMPKLKREQLFINMLESIYPDDAYFVCAVKDKNLTMLYNTLTVDVINQAFPGLIEQPTETKQNKRKEVKQVNG